jgi:hypothetical protein
MVSVVKFIIKIVAKFFVFIWDFIFFFFGMPYEKQAKKLDMEKHDPFMRGPEDEKPKYTVYRANRAVPKEY